MRWEVIVTPLGVPGIVLCIVTGRVRAKTITDQPCANSVQAGACRRGDKKLRGSVTGRVREKAITDHLKAKFGAGRGLPERG